MLDFTSKPAIDFLKWHVLIQASNMHRQGNCAGLNLQYKVYQTFQITLQNVCYPERFNCNSQEKNYVLTG
jgi:hypothetical protein